MDETAYRTQDRRFDKYWRFLRDDPTKPAGQMPNGDVYAAFNRRNNTFFVDHVYSDMSFNEVGYSWTALLNEILRGADALYWFSDFDDPVSDKQLAVVRENLDLRKQRLYIHPQKRGISFEKVRDALAVPTGGEVVEPKVKK
jgi:hypothetical protein